MHHPDHELGVLYYAFPVLLPHLSSDTGWSTTAATGAFSATLLVSALAGIPSAASSTGAAPALS